LEHLPFFLLRALGVADLTKGNFQLSYLKWVGANNDPDVFALVFSTKRIPPNGSNLGRYRNPKVDELTDAIRVEMNQPKRKQLTSEVQKIVAEDLPYIPSGTPTWSASTAAPSATWSSPPPATTNS